MRLPAGAWSPRSIEGALPSAGLSRSFQVSAGRVCVAPRGCRRTESTLLKGVASAQESSQRRGPDQHNVEQSQDHECLHRAEAGCDRNPAREQASPGCCFRVFRHEMCPNRSLIQGRGSQTLDPQEAEPLCSRGAGLAQLTVLGGFLLQRHYHHEFLKKGNQFSAPRGQLVGGKSIPSGNQPSQEGNYITH